MSPAHPRTETAPAPSPLRLPQFRALLLAQAAFGLAYSIFLILPKLLAQGLGADTARVGWIMASAGLANVMAAPFVALLLGRAGARRGLVVGSVLMAAASLAYVFVDRPGPLAFVARGCQGIAWAVMFSAGGALAAALAPPGRLSQSIGLYASSNLVTNAIGPALAEPAIAAWGARPVFACASAIALGAAVLAARLQVGGARVAVASSRADAEAGKREPLPRFLLLVSVVVGIACGAMFTFHQPLALARGINRVSDFLVAYTVVAVLVRLVGGRLTDRIGPARVAFGSFILYAAVVAAMTGLAPGGLVPLGALFGLAHGIFFPAFLALALASGAPENRERVITWINATFNAGTIAVAGLGAVAHRSGFAWVFIPTGLLVLATALGLRQARPRLSSRPT